MFIKSSSNETVLLLVITHLVIPVRILTCHFASQAKLSLEGSRLFLSVSYLSVSR